MRKMIRNVPSTVLTTLFSVEEFKKHTLEIKKGCKSTSLPENFTTIFNHLCNKSDKFCLVEYCVSHHKTPVYLW